MKELELLISLYRLVILLRIFKLEDLLIAVLFLEKLLFPDKLPLRPVMYALCLLLSEYLLNSLS